MFLYQVSSQADKNLASLVDIFCDGDKEKSIYTMFLWGVTSVWKLGQSLVSHRSLLKIYTQINNQQGLSKCIKGISFLRDRKSQYNEFDWQICPMSRLDFQYDFLWCFDLFKFSVVTNFNCQSVSNKTFLRNIFQIW